MHGFQKKYHSNFTNAFKIIKPIKTQTRWAFHDNDLKIIFLNTLLLLQVLLFSPHQGEQRLPNWEHNEGVHQQR